MKASASAHAAICWKILTIAASLAACLPASAAPLNFRGVNYQAVMVAPNYPGAPAFDDNLDISRAAFASGLSTWANWRRSPGGNIDELPGNATAADFLNAFAPYQAGGAQALGAGDLFLAFYFGHGTTGVMAPGDSGEQAPALNVFDESMVFANNSAITDDAMRAALAAFDPGVFKFFIDVSCFSGGMWNGNDAVGGGDLEQVIRSILITSSSENQFTFAGGVGPRPWEPLLLVKMISTLFFADHSRDLSIGEFYARSAVAGSAANASRFAEDSLAPGNELWGTEASGDFESQLFQNVSAADLPRIGAAPEPATLGLLGFGLALIGFARRRNVSQAG